MFHKNIFLLLRMKQICTMSRVRCNKFDTYSHGLTRHEIDWDYFRDSALGRHKVPESSTILHGQSVGSSCCGGSCSPNQGLQALGTPCTSILSALTFLAGEDPALHALRSLSTHSHGMSGSFSSRKNSFSAPVSTCTSSTVSSTARLPWST